MSTRPAPAVDLVDVDAADDTAFADWTHSANLAFLEPRANADRLAVRREQLAGHRLVAARAGGRTVGTFRSYDTELSLPGTGAVTVDAVTTVTVAATHRRRGVLTEMMGRELVRAREAGHALAALIAAEAPIYGRFGYGPATRSTSWALDTHATAFRPDGPTGGTVESLSLDEALPDLVSVHDAARRARGGGLQRESTWWSQWRSSGPRGLSPAAHVLVHRDGRGTADGYAVHVPEESWQHRVATTRTTVVDLQVHSNAAYRDLLETVAGTDTVRTVVAADRPVDEVLPHLLVDPRAFQSGPVHDFLWVRVLDVTGALAARRYLTGGCLVLRVVDPQGYTGGTVRLTVDEASRRSDDWISAEVTATDDDPDVTLDVGDLGAVLMGGTSPVALADAGRVAGHPLAVLRLQTLLATPDAPWCATWF